ncbi:oligosaccharide flippase family protein [Sphingomonas soli]|uniref:oligosaccharide flippase family protein n=1 Tax=Sphingomonas soli TaxID=266127 RepID=UPI0008348648|nr:polysaccharide biosynthesis C-terminal domain-containing protein [Sphingomonas soli]
MASAAILSLLQKLRAGSASKVFGLSVANAVFGLATATLLARVMGPYNFGSYNFLLAVLAIVSFPIGTGLRQVVLRETAYAVARPDALHPYHTWLWAYRTAALLCVVAAAIGIAWAAMTVGITGNITVGILLIVILFAVPLMHVGVGSVQGMGFVVTSQIPEYLIRPIGILVIMGAIALVNATRPLTLETAIAVYAVTCVIGAGAALWWLRTLSAKGLPDRPIDRSAAGALNRRALVTAAVSFGMIQSVQLIMDNVDTVMLGLLTSPTQIAHYRVASAIATLASFAIIAVNTVISSEIARLHALGARDELQKLIHMSTRVSALISFASLIAILVGGHLALLILFGAEYGAAAVPLYILALGRFFASCFGPVATVLSLTGHERMTLAGLCASALCNVVLNPLLIPHFGAAGAAMASASSLMVWSIFLWVSLRRSTGFTTMFGPSTRNWLKNRPASLGDRV